jgi:uncharacterized repeat protein (TIGR03803 family)
MTLFIDVPRKALVCAALAVLAMAPLESAQARKDSVVYSFTGGADGASPAAGFVADASGNLYSTAFGGGASGHGDVFELSANGTRTVLYSFTGGADGGAPQSNLIRDKDGNLFGTTSAGGAKNIGTVFMLAPNGTEAVLHSFKGGYDGAYPEAGLIADGKGNLYGTTQAGGGAAYCGGGCGTVFRISRSGKEEVIYAFAGSPDGAYPAAGLVADRAGNLYGTTLGGGLQSNYCGIGCGIAFELSPSGGSTWSETVIHAFVGGGSDGINPAAGLTADGAGNFYGTTTLGGNLKDCIAAAGCGSVFELSPAQNGAWSEVVVYAFKGGSDGSTPYAGLIRDGGGNFYGTTFEGGLSNCPYSSGCGTVFRISARGHENVLHAFAGATGDGANSQSALYADGKGTLIGTTDAGGATQGCFENQGCGTAFTLKQ